MYLSDLQLKNMPSDIFPTISFQSHTSSVMFLSWEDTEPVLCAHWKQWHWSIGACYWVSSSVSLESNWWWTTWKVLVTSFTWASTNKHTKKIMLQVFFTLGNKRENCFSKLAIFAELNEGFCKPFKRKATGCRIVPLMEFIPCYEFSPVVARL